VKWIVALGIAVAIGTIVYAWWRGGEVEPAALFLPWP
jgi:hypothetical protein